MVITVFLVQPVSGRMAAVNSVMVRETAPPEIRPDYEIRALEELPALLSKL